MVGIKYADFRFELLPEILISLKGDSLYLPKQMLDKFNYHQQNNTGFKYELWHIIDINIETICDPFSVVYGRTHVLPDKYFEVHVSLPFYALFRVCRQIDTATSGPNTEPIALEIHGLLLHVAGSEAFKLPFSPT